MLTRFAKLFMVLTSFSLTFLSCSISRFFNNGYKFDCYVFLGVFEMLCILSLCLIIVKMAENRMEKISFEITSIKTADGEVIGFLVAYLLPLVNLGEVRINMPVMIFVMLIFIVVIWSTNSYHINPLLAIAGYHFYEVTNTQNITFLLVTRKDLRNTRSVKKVVQLTDYMIMDFREEN